MGTYGGQLCVLGYCVIRRVWLQGEMGMYEM